ncbi:trypsin-like serine peptidase [Acanthopleuribacter pedis]|uniref:Serine protease n=1 Tax=Acanthopleuribacter pedis TaxID=442870 RepID=A0A8J7QG42_9BACT|nr:hypothetical protein [Acanthopleuribacter pedis]MBO1321660.1 hypothetical protein [Acanthopleuribacter pedis]
MSRRATGPRPRLSSCWIALLMMPGFAWSQTFAPMTKPVKKSGVVSTTVERDDIVSLQLRFGVMDLKPDDFLVITAEDDNNASQRMDVDDLVVWDRLTAWFNGNSVKVDLHWFNHEVAPQIAIANVYTSEIYAQFLDLEKSRYTDKDACSLTDRRIPTRDDRMGRLMPVGCTGFIMSNGTYLTAGHCNYPVVGSQTGNWMQIMQLNVPFSYPNGQPRHPPPEYQFPVLQASINTQSGPPVPGHDWLVYDCGPNSNTGLTPIQAGNFFRGRQIGELSSDARINITGFGSDNQPPGSSGAFNARSQSLQVATGFFLTQLATSALNNQIRYIVDTEGGNSGSPVIVNGTDHTIAIHTDGLCQTQGFNVGTSFNLAALATAINQQPIRNQPTRTIAYLDGGTLAGADSDGTYFKPFANLTGWWINSVVHATLVVTPGDYGYETLNGSLSFSPGLQVIVPKGRVSFWPRR